jgi:hypothetical protein
MSFGRSRPMHMLRDAPSARWLPVTVFRSRLSLDDDDLAAFHRLRELRMSKSGTASNQPNASSWFRSRRATSTAIRLGTDSNRRVGHDERSPRPRRLSRIVPNRSAGADTLVLDKLQPGGATRYSLEGNDRRGGGLHARRPGSRPWPFHPIEAPGTNTDRPVFVGKLTSELHVTRREYYVNRAAEFLVASEQIPSDRNALLQMAATYVRIAIESECYTPPGPKASAPIDPNQAPQISI